MVQVCFGPSLREPRYFSIKKVFGIFYGNGIGIRINNKDLIIKFMQASYQLRAARNLG